MTTPRKIFATGASFTLVAILTGAIVWGGSTGTPKKKSSQLTGAIRSPGDAGIAANDEMALGRFAHSPVLTYETLQGELHFALQVQAKLPPVAAKPRDIAVVIDTSATQVGSPLKNARLIAEQLAKIDFKVPLPQ